MTTEELAYYATPSRTSLGKVYGDALREAPSDVPRLADWIHGLLIHEHLAWLYEQQLTPERRANSQHRFVDGILAGVLARGSAPLSLARSPLERSIGVCSHFSLLAVAVLRAHGIPARSRCGFGMYFQPHKGVDHWIVEVWDQTRWRLSDFQIDALQREQFKIGFDILDQPPGQFLNAAQAWQLCRRGQADPRAFGLFDEGGYWFIASNMIRDLANLNKVEMLPWDDWGAMPSPDQTISEAEFDRFDWLAALILNPLGLGDLQAAFQAEGFLMTGEVFNASRQVVESVQ